MQTKIDIISGFLGAGKTTLIQKLLSESLKGQKVVLIENEFGEIGIDGGILKQTGIQIREINSGCICCTLVGDFGAALSEVIGQYHPERILIEPSGVGKLSDVIKACQKVGLKEDIEVNLCIDVADATKYHMYSKNFGEFFNNQIEHAKTVVLSRTQKMDAEKLAAVVKEIQRHNPNAEIITTPWQELSGDKILSVAENSAAPLLNQDELYEHEYEYEHEHKHEHCHHNADEEFAVWSVQTPKVFRKDEIETLLEKLPDYGTVLRAKGIVPLAGGSWLQFDFVPDEVSSRNIEPDFSGRLCVIGKDLDKAGLAILFGV
nr:GTP-binding protein [uncultured Caproiciproducens sp.]